MGGVAAGQPEVQLTVLVTSPRVAAGLMSWPAWSAVASAARRLSTSPDSPLAGAVAAAGHPVEVVHPSVDAVLAACVGGTGNVVWLPDGGELERLLPELLAASSDIVEVTLVEASHDVAGSRLLDLVGVMDRLRTECPWDREQSHRSLAPYLLEESYETLEAIESGDLVHLREELGDLLLQVFFHARVAAEDGEAGFTIDDVAAGIVDKLVHRHPHVFARAADADPLTPDQVNRNWEALKATEKGRASVLDGIPVALPALALADKTLGRAARVGITPAGVDAGGLGAALLRLVERARAEGVDAEQALRDAVRRVADAVRAAEAVGS